MVEICLARKRVSTALVAARRVTTWNKVQRLPVLFFQKLFPSPSLPVRNLVGFLEKTKVHNDPVHKPRKACVQGCKWDCQTRQRNNKEHNREPRFRVICWNTKRCCDLKQRVLPVSSWALHIKQKQSRRVSMFVCQSDLHTLVMNGTMISVGSSSRVLHTPRSSSRDNLTLENHITLQQTHPPS